MRVKRAFDDALLVRLNREFKDMLSGGGGFERMSDITGDDNRDTGLHRIVFPFNRSSYCRMRHLIDVLNNLPSS